MRAILDLDIDHAREVYRRRGNLRPQPEDNPYGAWAVETRIQGARYGKLAGKRVAIKDNVCVAGVQMMNGASILEGYVPEIDATIVTRLLDEGAEILGKAVCEYYCASGGSHTSANGIVENPVVPGYNAGGSSSGSTALVAAGVVDMATGGDQGGSIRIPASYCAVVGLKPTHGLVPYTGIFAVELTVDHAGPIARTVADCALMLEVMAGPDGLDPRQSGAPSQLYTQGLAVSQGLGSAWFRRGSARQARRRTLMPGFAKRLNVSLIPEPRCAMFQFRCTRQAPRSGPRFFSRGQQS
jgi:amidase